MTATPIPAGVLTVDDKPMPPRVGLFGGDPSSARYVARLNGVAIGAVDSEQRARLLAGPPRPDGVPDGAVPATIWISAEDDRGWCKFYSPAGQADAALAEWWRDRGVPVPPYQPTTPAATCVACGGYGHDPVECASDDDHERERRDHPCAACQPTPPEPTACLRCNGRGRVPDSIYEVSVVCPACDGSRVQPTPAEPEPADEDFAEPPYPMDSRSVLADDMRDAEARTGPLGLSEGDRVQHVASGRIAAFVRYAPRGMMLVESIESGERLIYAPELWEPVRDTTPQPAETLTDIVADLRWFQSPWLDRFADRIEAATRPDPDTITINLPRQWAEHFADEAAGAYSEWVANEVRAALAAAGLPQEPTEGDER